MMIGTSRRIEGCVVTNSSGCHRYDYWNEQALFDGREDTGWCSPSRTGPTTEFLEIDLRGRYEVCGVRLLSRAINENAGFPGRIELLASDAGPWLVTRVLTDVTCRASAWFAADFSAVWATRLLLLLSDAARRPDGKYFTQFMALEILHMEGGASR